MWTLLNKLFIVNFYKTNGGFFLAFFLFFFGAVEGSSLISYHLSLMDSILHSKVVLLLVCIGWTLYHLKCSAFFLRIINSSEGQFLATLQAVDKKKQWLFCTALHTAVYAPVLIYAWILVVIGLNSGYAENAIIVLLYQLFSITFFAGFIYYRLNHWLEKFSLPTLSPQLRKSFLLLLLFHFTIERKKTLLWLKCFSWVLLYGILIWNKESYDNDSFLIFYLVLLLSHAVIPYFSVQFFEQNFAISRNLPISLLKRAVAFFLPFCLLFVPDIVYLFYHGTQVPFSAKVGYALNLPVCLFLLTAFLYSGAQSRKEYLKATFILSFVTLFSFHMKAFWFCIVVELLVSIILFACSYDLFEKMQFRK